ncbi:GMC oxidoreductase [Cupriavidus oxalaticus]|uniref:GMC oxidoreductase n=1 Tax=Cupriavidus taiwanensis TaxID=164546 RepID=UPI0027956381|nr:GMC oxidoreductase [Cupriavidus taiwanensis]
MEREIRPGIDVKDDASLLDYIKARGQTSWHPAGTCKMGVDDMAVVDPELCVRGTVGLRVADSSIISPIRVERKACLRGRPAPLLFPLLACDRLNGHGNGLGKDCLDPVSLLDAV